MSKNKKIVLIVIVALLIIIIASIALVLKLKKNNDGDKDNKEIEEVIEIPDLIGTDSGTAEEILEKLGFTVKITESVSEDENNKLGEVYNQEPIGKASKNTEVNLFTYVGSDLITLPNVVGMQKDEAKTLLTTLGFSVAFQSQEVESEPVDVILSQDKALDKYVKGTTIKLVYSKLKEEVNNGDNSSSTKANSSKNNNSNANTTNKDNNANNSNNGSSNNNEVNNNQNFNNQANGNQNNNSSNSNNNNSNNSGNTNNNELAKEPEKPKPSIKMTGDSHYRKGYVSACFQTTIKNSDIKDVVFSSSNTKVATVDSRGCVTPIANYGHAKITATIKGTDIKTYKYIYVVSIRGDVDGDGMVNANDASLLYDYVDEKYIPNALMSVGDIDKDGKITDDDAQFILDYFKYMSWDFLKDYGIE